MSVSSTSYIYAKLFLLTSSSPIQAMPFSLRGPIAVFSPQKSHFPKMKHTTFLESRKGGSGFSSQRPSRFSPTSVSTPASHPHLEDGHLSCSCVLASIVGACVHTTSCPQGTLSTLRTGTPTYSHLFSPQCLARDGSQGTGWLTRRTSVKVCQIELVW